MIYQSEYANLLLAKYLQGIASPAEMAEIRTIWDLYDDEELAAMISEMMPVNTAAGISDTLERWHPDREAIQKLVIQSRSLRFKNRLADFFKKLFLFLFIFFLITIVSHMINRQASAACNGMDAHAEIPAGEYPTKLVLSNKEERWIDGYYSSPAIIDGNFAIVQPEKGTIAYNRKDTATVLMDSSGFNTITTTRGQQRILLPDGTAVRLNAGSSLRFPLTFSPAKRVVEINGEALLDIAVADNSPFYIGVKQVYNTVFISGGCRVNVNSYSHGIYATLINGTLIVKRNEDSTVLIKGQTAFINRLTTAEGYVDSSFIISDKLDTTIVESWKNAIRRYDKTPMKEFVTDMGRWFNLEIINLDCVSNRAISAGICYTTGLEQVLDIFRGSGLHFVNEGNKIIFCKPQKTGTLAER